MTAKIIDGKRISEEILGKLTEEVSNLKQKGITPGLAVVLVGENHASETYVKFKREACKKLGIANFDHNIPSSVSEHELLDLIHKLNKNDSVHGILIQLPLPEHINEERIVEAVNPEKDVDCFHPINVGKLFLGKPKFLPCTPAGIIELLDASKIELAGKKAVVLGRSNIVGKPVAALLTAKNATVTVCHSKTTNLPEEIKQADALIAAIGELRFVKGEWIKKGAVVIDVGINRDENGKLSGDVDFESASKNASAITPVPGGVGPMTIASLMKNVIKAAKEKIKS